MAQLRRLAAWPAGEGIVLEVGFALGLVLTLTALAIWTASCGN
jgi:hypothetical protein